MKIILTDLPKISLNKFYAGIHHRERMRIKELFYYSIKSQTKIIFSKHDTYNVDYLFEFKGKPLDASNCVGMIKIIEDILFENDAYNIVLSIKIRSIKSNQDRVVININ